MIVRTLALLSLILVLPPSLAAAAEPANQTAEPDVWPDHAVPDGDAARQGRSALPFTQGADRDPGPAVAPDPAGERAGGRASHRKAVSGGSVSMGRAMGKSRCSR